MSTVLIIIIGVAVVLLLIVLACYNGLVKVNERVNEAWSDITVQLKYRADLIPNLVETVKGYEKHEKEVFSEVTEARSASLGAKTVDAAARAETKMNNALSKIMAIAEAYPELKASENFKTLQSQLQDIEDKIQAARRFYNASAKDLNTKVKLFSDTVATKSNPGGVISVVTNKPSNDSSSSSTPTNNPPKNTSTSNTSSSSIADGIYVIKCSGDPNYVLTLKNNKVTANNELVVYQWQNTNYQKWKVENAGDGTITIKSMADNKYSIGVDPNGVFDHAQVVSLLCKNQKNERWVPQKNSKGYFFLKLLANKDFFLDVLDFNYFNNNIVQVCGYYGEHNQQFIFQKL